MATEERARPRKITRDSRVIFDRRLTIASRSYRLVLSTKQKDIPCVTGSEQITGCPLVVTQMGLSWKQLVLEVKEWANFAREYETA